MTELPGQRRPYSTVAPSDWLHLDGVWVLVTKTRRVEVLGAPHRVVTVAGPVVDEEVGPVPDGDMVQACTRPEARAARLSLLREL